MHGPYRIRLGTWGAVSARMRRGDGVLGSSMRPSPCRPDRRLAVAADDRSGLSHTNLTRATVIEADRTGADSTDPVMPCAAVFLVSQVSRAHRERCRP